MSVTEVIKQRKQVRRNAAASSQTTAHPAISAKLGELQGKADRIGYKLSMAYLKDSERVISSIESDPSVVRLCKMLLALNHEFSLCKNITFHDTYKESLAGALNDSPARYNEAIEGHFTTKLTESIDSCLQLMEKKGQKVHSPVRGVDGRCRNSKLKSIYSLLYGMALEKGLTFSFLTLDFAKHFDIQPISTKVLESLKNSLNYRISKAVPDRRFAGAFVFEVKKRNLHSHALLIHPGCNEGDIKSALKPLSAGLRNSVQLKPFYTPLRMASTVEALNLLKLGHEQSDFNVIDRSAVTAGAADYISKDLGKSLGYRGRASRVITLNKNHLLDADYNVYHKARQELLTYIGKALEPRWKSANKEKVMQALLHEHGILKEVFDLYTFVPNECSSAA